MLQRLLTVICAGVVVSGLPGPASATNTAATAIDDELARQPSWTPPCRETLREQTAAWLAMFSGGAAAAAIEAWDDSAEPLDAVVAIIRQADPRAAAIDAATAGPAAAAWLDGTGIESFERDAVRLWLARELVRRTRFDEALPLLAGLDPATSVDPATLLFHRAACQHWLLDAEAAVESLDLLLERAGEIPVRYERVARLLRADIAGLDEGSLDHVSRRMRDITRRLDLGRAGPTTRRVQDGVVASLDRLIKELEDQQQQQGAAGTAGAGGGAAGGQGGAATPMNDSHIAGGQGKGEAQARDVGDGDGWGNLPPHAREAAIQQISREFPPHYREAIELYFKRLAAGSEDR
jgi:hypothetical protein